MIQDHVAILLYHSLDVARVSKLKAKRGPVFFAQFAFPPEAGADLQALAASVAPGGNLAGLEIGGFQVAGSLKKPIPGIPGNWLTVRSESQFAPTLVDSHGAVLQDGATIRSLFYPGRRVRAAITAFPWVHTETGRKGVSFNLQGVMDAGPGEKLNIGNGVVENEFQKYAQAGSNGAGNPFGGQSPAPSPAPAGGSNPFASASSAPAGGSNPFAANTGANSAPANNNPFAQ